MNFSEMDEIYARYPKLPREYQSTAIAEVILALEQERAAFLRLARLVDFYGEALIHRQYEDGSLAIRDLVGRARSLLAGIENNDPA